MLAESYHIPSPPCLVAFTAAMIFSCVDIVGILSTTWSTACGTRGVDNIMHNRKSLIRTPQIMIFIDVWCALNGKYCALYMNTIAIQLSDLVPTVTIQYVVMSTGSMGNWLANQTTSLVPRLSLLKRGYQITMTMTNSLPHDQRPKHNILT